MAQKPRPRSRLAVRNLGNNLESELAGVSFHLCKSMVVPHWTAVRADRMSVSAPSIGIPAAKTVTTVSGPVDITAPRTAMARSNPAIVPKKTRQLNNINSVVLSLHSRGMTTRDIETHLEEVYGAAVSQGVDPHCH